MSEIQDEWGRGYRDGWADQGVLPTSEPTIPPVPTQPSNVTDPKQWAYDAGKIRGAQDRMRKQAGIS